MGWPNRSGMVRASPRPSRAELVPRYLHSSAADIYHHQRNDLLPRQPYRVESSHCDLQQQAPTLQPCIPHGTSPSLAQTRRNCPLTLLRFQVTASARRPEAKYHGLRHPSHAGRSRPTQVRPLGETVSQPVSVFPNRQVLTTGHSEAWRYRGVFTRWNRFKGGLPGFGIAAVAFTAYCIYEHYFLSDPHHKDSHGTEHH